MGIQAQQAFTDTSERASPHPDQFANEIDALGQSVRAQLGDADARYIRRMILAATALIVSGRVLLYLSILWLPFAALGVVALALGKIVENMEIGHNVMHGQYDWLGDPRLQGHTYEWDNAGPSDNWRATHNRRHHIYANIEGLDDDVAGLRLRPEQPWQWRHLLQPGAMFASAALFQWAVAAHNMDLGEWRRGRKEANSLADKLRPVLKKSGFQLFKDYLFFPALAGPWFLQILLGNLFANGLRNIWAWAVIICNHCPEGVAFYPRERHGKETRSERYTRQVCASANFSGPSWLHVLSGHLGYHIEHHLFPDIPACRYPEMALQVQAICQQHGIPYNCRSFPAQLASALKRIVRYAFP